MFTQKIPTKASQKVKYGIVEGISLTIKMGNHIKRERMKTMVKTSPAKDLVYQMGNVISFEFSTRILKDTQNGFAISNIPDTLAVKIVTSG